MGESGLMTFVEWYAGVEEAHYLLADYPDEVEELFDVMHQNFLKRFEVSIEHSPADTLHLLENTSTTLISPGQYEEYCYPQIVQYGNMAHQGGQKLMLHMCGHLKAILPLLGNLPADAFEAFTTPTIGNATLAEGRAACPDKCLVGGTNALVWLESAEDIIKYIEEGLESLPHHRGIFMSSGGEMPRDCAPETIQKVKAWLDTYPLRF